MCARTQICLSIRESDPHEHKSYTNKVSGAICEWGAIAKVHGTEQLAFSIKEHGGKQ